jgi:glutamate-ammonia-ligase adenylyltransferase
LAFRNEIQSSAKIHNLKRGEGGTFDIECLVQLLQLSHASAHPEILAPGTLEAIGLLEHADILKPDDARYLYDGYYFLREIEAGLRLMNTTARHDLPEEIKELDRLAVLLGWKSGRELREKTDEIRARHREIFARYVTLA